MQVFIRVDQKPIIICAGVFLTLASIPAFSENTHHHAEKNSYANETHAAHVHGSAKLLVVLEREQLHLELRSPAINLLGFEQQIKTEAQQNQLTQTKALLADAGKLFEFNAAQCRLSQHSVEIFGLDAQGNSNLHDHSDQGDSNHRDIRANYQYRCDNADVLNSLKSHINQLFPAIDNLQVEWIVNARQGATTLTKKQRVINFR